LKWFLSRIKRETRSVSVMASGAVCPAATSAGAPADARSLSLMAVDPSHEIRKRRWKNTSKRDAAMGRLRSYQRRITQHGAVADAHAEDPPDTLVPIQPDLVVTFDNDCR